MTDSTRQILERVHRQEDGQLLATLIGWLGDLELAEEALEDAFLAAVEHWERERVPHKPGAWRTTTARRQAIDRLRRSRPPVAPQDPLPPLTVLYLIFTEGYAATAGEALIRHELCAEAIRLCRVLELLIRQTQTDVQDGQYAEVLGLLGLMLLHHSRRTARLGSHGELILLN